MPPGRGDVILEYSRIFAPATFALFCVALQVGIGEISKGTFRSDFCTLVSGVLAANDRGFGLERSFPSVEDRECWELSERNSAHPPFDSAFPYETLYAVVGNAKGESLELIIADENLTVTGDSNSFDESLRDIGHVDVM
jgi:hypothetical protein